MSNSAIRSFVSGELSPDLWGRSDLQQYASGARTVRNFLVRRQGGLDNRPGTEYLTSTGLARSRVIAFVFNDTQAYALLFTVGAIAMWRAGGLATFVITTYAADELFDLQVTQSADVMTIVHPSHPVYELRRLADNNWTWLPVTFAPEIAAPTGLAIGGSVNGTDVYFVVTALSASGQESLPSTELARASFTFTRMLTWNLVAGAVGYNIYQRYGAALNGGGFGFVGTTNTERSFPVSMGTVTDDTVQPPAARPVFAAAGDYPGAVGQYQQRQLYAGSTNQPQTVFTSRAADRANFLVSVPTQDDDALTFTLLGRKVNTIRHFVDVGTLVLLTSGGEYVVRGDQADILRPTDIGPKRLSQHGAAGVPPIDLDTRIIYVQNRQSTLRSLVGVENGQVQSEDLTIVASHLFAGHTIVDLAYAENPNSIIWAVRDDGVLLGLTEVLDQRVRAWHRHDTEGLVESVCVVPEGTEDRLYLVVNRGGHRYLERMCSRRVADIQDAIFTDSTLSYDGRNTDAAKTMALSGSSSWDYQELVTVTATGTAPFTAGQITTGDGVFVTGPDGTQIRITMTEYVSTSVVRGFPQRTIPESMQGVALSTWALAVQSVGNLAHLEGRTVSVFADGYVVASPNNPEVALICVVSGGAITLDRPYAYIHVGLPYVSDLETLDMDTPSGPSMREKKQTVNKIFANVVASRGMWAGGAAPPDDGIAGLFEFKLRDQEPWSAPVSLATGVVEVGIDNGWQNKGRVFFRQIDPVPVSLNALIPAGYLTPGSP